MIESGEMIRILVWSPSIKYVSVVLGQRAFHFSPFPLSRPIPLCTFCLFPEKIKKNPFEKEKKKWRLREISTWKPRSSDSACREPRRTINLLRSTPTKELCRPTTKTCRIPPEKITPIPQNAPRKIRLPPSKYGWMKRVYD